MDIEQKVDALNALADEYKDCDRCELACPSGRSRRNVVFADGNADASLMIIGEAPGEQEDLKGFPFAGPSGVLFDKFLHSFSSDRDEVFFTNIVCCRPTEPENPGKGRKPSKEEIESCRERLHQTIEIVDPYVILVLGSAAMKAVSSHKGGITAIAKDPDYPCASSVVRGQCKDVERPTIATFHPSYLLRSDSMEEGSDMYHAYYAWKKAFDLADMCSHIYTGETPPQRGNDA